MTRALVLNATYEPLSVVSGRRAALLVLAARADVVAEGDHGALRSEHLCVNLPSVIKLRYFVKMPFGRRSALSRRGVFARDGHRCQYCGARAESIDHVMPKGRGGAHSWDNVVAACRRCNSSKRDRLLGETSMRLERAPSEPPVGSWVALSVPRVPDAWEPYIVLARSA